MIHLAARPLIALAVAFSAAGCGGYSNDDLEFLYALPSRQTLQTSVPSETGVAQSGLGVRRDGLAVGDPSKAHADSKAGSDTFNGLLFHVLDVLERVRSARPSERGDNRRVWGPFNDEKNREKQVRVVMERRDEVDGSVTYAWRVEVKRRADPDDAWLVGVEGAFDATSDVRRGAGHFIFHAARIREAGLDGPKDDPELTQLDVTYATDGDPLEVSMTLVNPNRTLTYGFQRFADGSGSIEFELVADLYKPFLGDDREQLTILSRWDATGAGRSDMQVTGGDLGADKRDAVECWDAAFLVAYARPFDFSGDPEVGTPSACVLAAPTP